MKNLVPIFAGYAIVLAPFEVIAADYSYPRLRGTVVHSDTNWQNLKDGSPRSGMGSKENAQSMKMKEDGEDENGKNGENGDDGKEDETAEDNGKNFTFTPFAAASVGVDTNPDESTPPDDVSTLFQRYDTGLTLKYDHDGVEIEFDAQAEFIDLFEYADPRRWYYEFGLDGSIDMSRQTKFLFGAKREHDKLSDPETALNTTYAGLKREARSIHFGMRGELEQKLNLTGDDDFGAENAEAFDYVKSSAQLDVLFAAHRGISPFVRSVITNVNFPRQDIQIADRDASGYALVGGIAFRPSDRFRLDVGGRYNYRETDDLSVSSHDNSFVDVSLTWKPSERLDIKGAITREITEPDTEASILADLTTYQLGAEWQATEKFGLEMSGEITVTDEIGAGETSRETRLEGKAHYNIHDKVRMFSAVSRLWGEDTFTDSPKEKYDRTVVRGGIETDF